MVRPLSYQVVTGTNLIVVIYYKNEVPNTYKVLASAWVRILRASGGKSWGGKHPWKVRSNCDMDHQVKITADVSTVYTPISGGD